MPDTSYLILGFDFGMKRIGTAIGDTLTATARPLTTLPAKDGVPQWSTIQTIITEWDIKKLIVGMPYTLDGEMQDTTFAARKFGKKLYRHFHLPVIEVDERLTTKTARAEHRHDTQRKRHHEIDCLAAKLITEIWLTNHHHEEE